MELDGATMAVSLVGFELGSRHCVRAAIARSRRGCYKEEIRNVARQQALLLMYLPHRRVISRLRSPRYVTAILPRLSHTKTLSKAAIGHDNICN